MSYKFEGSKYEETKGMDIKDIAKLVRADIKKVFPDVKVSVRIDRYSGGQSLDVTIKEAPYFVNNPERIKAQTNSDGSINWQRDISRFANYSEAGTQLIKGIESILNQYNFDDSESQVDYFRVRFYSSVRLGRELEESERARSV